ncbi:MAG: pullulanase-type alpha-1,6-glucosidase [Anaerolineae bacterium]|nr:pullulanase-type alpha-1,6-glucosidase [Anaerolineae bacterium]
MLLVLTAVSITYAQSDDPASLPPPDSVTIAGTIQPQLGCSGEWNTTCTESQLVYSAEDDLWLATFELAAGDYEYKAALNGSWDDNYGLNAEYYGPNIPLTVAEDGPVTFWYDHKTRWVSDNINSLIANVPGSFQDEIGCPGEWAPDCLRSLLQDPNGDGIYTFITGLIPAGEYEAKVAIGQSLDENYGVDGVADGANIPFTVGEGQAVIFTFDPATQVITVETTDEIPAGLITSLDQVGGTGGSLPSPAAPFPDQAVIPGTIQSVLGCSGDWQPECEVTALTFDEEDQVWTAVFDIPAGSYEYKVALNGNWDVNFGLNAEPGGANIPLVLAEDTAVTYYFDHNTGWVADSVNHLIANVPGDFQSEIGCPDDWQPDCLRSWLQDPDGDGTFTFQTVSIPAGSYEAKVAVNQSWDENYGESGATGGANIPFAVPEDGTLVTFTWNSDSKLLTIGVGAGAGPTGNLAEQRAHWVHEDLILWDVDAADGNQYFFHYDPAGNAFSLTPTGMSGGTAVPLTVLPDGIPDEIAARFPHLRNAVALQLAADDLGFVRIALKGQTAVSAQTADGQILDATGLQIPGVLDDLYAYDGELGITWDGDIPTLRVWAPTARLVRLHLFDDSNPNTRAQISPMRVDSNTGVWSITGEPEWKGKYYLYEVQVYVPSEGSVQTNLVTDPYSFSLAQNSRRSQIVDLNDAALMPDGWETLEKPALAAPEDIVLYELHMRDFSVNDPTVPDELKGTYLAFTVADSLGMTHLRRLAEAGLTHIHLLPTFDIATINEDKTTWQSPAFAELAGFPPDSEEQQALVEAAAETDGFNWGYDPLHYTVPEGSYATNADGAVRILEYRQMVQALNQSGLRLVMDVVYNHTNAAGQSDFAVLDRIVPGYYHRLNAAGKVERSTCCANTASENAMMRKLMVDSVLTWAEAYKVDGFRFDLMGHHMKEDMLAVRAALDGLTEAENGVEGTAVYIYGEGWDFGEVAANARGVNATQLNMGSTGIGTFNDRIRDAIRGGNPFGDYQNQGFINGLYYDPNEIDQGSEEQQLARLLELTDHLRVGLAGNLEAFEFVGADGEPTTGRAVLYNGQFTGYAQDPQETINYASAHDNETLFDAIQYKAPAGTTAVERAQMQQMGLSLVMLGQGIPFFHAGSDLLRSKDFDRDSYNSGDWFNRLDFSYETNNWGVGLSVASKNQENWPLQQPLLANPALAPDGELIRQTTAHFQTMLQLRHSSPLFRLQTAEEIMARLQFDNTGPDQIPGLIVMSLSDQVGTDLDPQFDQIVVLFNANDEAQTFMISELAGMEMVLHPVLAASSDGRYAEMSYDAASGAFAVPGRSTAVFVLPEVADAVSEEETAAVIEEASEETVVETAASTPLSAGVTPQPEPTSAPAANSEESGLSPIWGIAGIGLLVALVLAFFGIRRRQGA